MSGTKEREPSGCSQPLHRKQCSCHVWPPYSSFRDPVGNRDPTQNLCPKLLRATLCYPTPTKENPHCFHGPSRVVSLTTHANFPHTLDMLAEHVLSPHKLDMRV